MSDVTHPPQFLKSYIGRLSGPASCALRLRGHNRPLIAPLSRHHGGEGPEKVDSRLRSSGTETARIRLLTQFL